MAHWINSHYHCSVYFWSLFNSHSLVGQEVLGDTVSDSYSSGAIPQGIDRATSQVFADKLFDSMAEFPITLMSLELIETDKLNQRQLVLRQLVSRLIATAFRTSKNNFYSQAKEFCWLGAAMLDRQERVNQKQEQARDILLHSHLNNNLPLNAVDYA